jgi:hypothetical protein
VIILSLLLLGLACADLVRWSPEPVPRARLLLAASGAIAGTLVLMSLSGLPAEELAIVDASTLAVVFVWLALDSRSPGYQLGLLLVALLAAFAASGTTGEIRGPLMHWYTGLPFHFVQSISVDQFLLGFSVALFLLATANRIVRLVLQAAGTPVKSGERALKGGRILGPMERIFLAAMVVSGNVAAAAALIAAKGLLRFPEIRTSARADAGADQITEYFLIGTFCSLLVAGALAALVSASG